MEKEVELEKYLTELDTDELRDFNKWCVQKILAARKVFNNGVELSHTEKYQLALDKSQGKPFVEFTVQGGIVEVKTQMTEEEWAELEKELFGEAQL